MDKCQQKKIASLIKRELSKPDTTYMSKPTTREKCIRIISIISGIIFLINSVVYYGRVLGANNSKVSNNVTKVMSKPKSELLDKKENDDVFTLKKKGDEALRLNKEKEAIEYYKKVIRANPKEQSVLINLTNLLIKNKLYDDSLNYLDKIINIQPLNISAYRVKGSSLYLLERYDEAIKVYSKVVGIDQEDNNSYKLMGDMSLKLYKYEDAINFYIKALAIKDKDAPVYQNLGLAEAKIGNFNEALNYYNKALQIDPENKAVLKNKQEILNVINR